MDRHFEDTVYYLSRAVETATRGVRSELAPVERRVRKATGREQEPEPSRVERVRSRVREARSRVEHEAGTVADRVRGRRRASGE